MLNHLTLILCEESDVKLKIIPLFLPVTILMLFLICGSLMYPQKTNYTKGILDEWSPFSAAPSLFLPLSLQE